MIHLALIMILAPFGAPEIVIDQDGFVTVIESPEERAKEDIFAGTVRAYNDYYLNGEGDLEELITRHETLLESDMELVPQARQKIGNQLAELRRERAIASVAITPERYREIKETPMPVFPDIFKDKEEEREYLKYKQIELQYEEQRIENLPEENAYYAAQLFHRLGITAVNILDAKSQQQGAHYHGRSRQMALEVAQKDDLQEWELRDALRLAETAGLWLVGDLKHLKDAPLCREFIATYPDDKELVEKIEELLDELESN